VSRTVTADEAAAALRPVDSLGMPLGPGQPPALLEALGRRTDWEHLRIGGALLTVLTDLFSHPNVHYLSGFFGPLERILRDTGANIGFAPADFRRFEPILQADPPRVMCTAATPPDAGGWCSLSLHAGATVAQLRAAGADPDRLLVVEVSDRFPRTYGLPDDHPDAGRHRHALPLDEIDLLVESAREPIVSEDPPPTDVDRAIAEHVRAFVPDGATLQTGIGAVPSTVARLLADGDGDGYGVHSEMFTTGLMELHQAGKVTNDRKGCYEGVSVATFAAGTRALYDWLHENRDVAFLPVEAVNAPELIARNRAMVTINAAMSDDIQGQVIADTIGGAQYSGIGGHEDFVAGPALDLEDRSLLCLPSTVSIAGELRSRIVPWFEAGAVITTPRHQVDVIVTEHGAAELSGKTVHQRGEALAAIAHPAFRDELLEAAERASHGRSPFPT
jgi:acyl-CoA hydrolase